MIVLYSRHFCRECDQRVFPFDSLEKLTEAPGFGVSGRKVLLSSLNARRQRLDPDDPVRVAWCWSCRKWTETYRETIDDIMQRYLKRRGVHYRARMSKQERRRERGKVLRLPKRRSA